MSQFTITITDPQTKSEFLAFAQSHHNVSIVKKMTEYDPDIYDNDGNFQLISLTRPGLPVPKEYILWRCEQSKKSILEGNGKSIQETMASFDERVNQLFRS